MLLESCKWWRLILCYFSIARLLIGRLLQNLGWALRDIVWRLSLAAFNWDRILLKFLLGKLRRTPRIFLLITTDFIKIISNFLIKIRTMLTLVCIQIRIISRWFRHIQCSIIKTYAMDMVRLVRFSRLLRTSLDIFELSRAISWRTCLARIRSFYWTPIRF